MKTTKRSLQKPEEKKAMREEDLKQKMLLSKKQVLKTAELIHRFRGIKSQPVEGVFDAPPRVSHQEEVVVKEIYRYDNLPHILGKETGCYKAYALGSYIHINFLEKKAPRERTAPLDRRAALLAMHAQPTGWKLHISIEPTQISEAWALIYPILMAHRVTGIKVLSPDVLARKMADSEEGRAEVACKQITIYQFQNKAVDAASWLNIMQEIEGALQSHAIGHGSRPLANHSIAGSQYFSYRNDSHPVRKGYISDKAAECYIAEHEHEAADLQAYNLINAPDPFEEINLHIGLQPDKSTQLR
ncbi:hypothetical protein [Legionella nagasakiensis]|uniref:hypothetical protein n=1 Tax=Legionella nagasakiensis TaxID=535290 RepID=UPI001055BB70|nr:hypothetical protein [Legionella nagasakiensis]